MTDAENFELLKECYGMGRGSDFCWGRCLVIDQCDDIPRDGLQRLCRFGGHNISEVLAGVEYQKSVFRAAAMLMSRGNANTRTYTDGHGRTRTEREHYGEYGEDREYGERGSRSGGARCRGVME